MLETIWSAFVQLLLNWLWCDFSQPIQSFVFLHRVLWELCSEEKHYEIKSACPRTQFNAYWAQVWFVNAIKPWLVNENISFWKYWKVVLFVFCSFSEFGGLRMTPLSVFRKTWDLGFWIQIAMINILWFMGEEIKLLSCGTLLRNR